MPTYEYECTKCKRQFEVFQSITSVPKRRCPKCKGKLLRKIGTGAGMIFKGSGFYATDYRSRGYREAVKKESSAATPKTEIKTSEPKSEGKTK